MAIYAIGDVQGCYQSLLCLLEKINFNKQLDTLWFTGDLVNRGDQSLEVLRFVKNLGDAARTVLGNHDLHLLAIALSGNSPKRKDTLDAIFNADDKNDLLEWLRHQSLNHYDADSNFLLVHAGIPPQWSRETAISLAREVENELQSDNHKNYFQNMYGNEPSTWNENLTGMARWRIITNYLTRMRFCDANGTLELECKLAPEHAPLGFAPWYSHAHRKTRDTKILFGHWASLQGASNTQNIYALDNGCVWGGKLTAMRLSDEMYFHCDCPSSHE